MSTEPGANAGVLPTNGTPSPLASAQPPADGDGLEEEINSKAKLAKMKGRQTHAHMLQAWRHSGIVSLEHLPSHLQLRDRRLGPHHSRQLSGAGYSQIPGENIRHRK